jgi:hypothetical protein
MSVGALEDAVEGSESSPPGGEHKGDTAVHRSFVRAVCSELTDLQQRLSYMEVPTG